MQKREIQKLLWAAACCGLTACESPLDYSSRDHSNSRYADSLLARSIADGTLSHGTINQGVVEKPRVTQASPPDETAAITPAQEEPASQPATIPSDGSGVALGQSEPTLRLSLQDAIERALRHNLAIKVSAYEPGIKEAQITEAQAIFDGVFFGQSQYSVTNDAQQPLRNLGTDGQSFNNVVGLRKLLSTGGTAQVTGGENYQEVNSAGSVFSSGGRETNNTGTLGLSVSQPLLRGFGPRVTNANIYIAQRDSRIARATFRRQTIEVIQQVEEGYFSLLLSRSNVEIQERLLQNTEETFGKIKARQAFDADRIQLSQARAAIEVRRAELVRARANVRDASDRLKTLLNDPDMDRNANVLLIPSDKPIDEPLALNLAEQVNIALRQRGELQEAKLTIEKADIILDVARNDLLPKLDMTVSTQSTAISRDFFAAFNNTWDAPKFIDYGAGLKFEIPLGNREKEAALRRRQLERRQSLTQMLQIAQRVVLDVRLALRDLLTSYEEIMARRVARQSAGEELDAILTRERVGEKLSPEFLQLKLDAQQRLASAEQLELQAMVTYNVAIAKLEQAKGTLLEYNHISLEPAPILEPENGGHVRFLGQSK